VRSLRASSNASAAVRREADSNRVGDIDPADIEGASSPAAPEETSKAETAEGALLAKLQTTAAAPKSKGKKKGRR